MACAARPFAHSPEGTSGAAAPLLEPQQLDWSVPDAVRQMQQFKQRPSTTNCCRSQSLLQQLAAALLRVTAAWPETTGAHLPTAQHGAQGVGRHDAD